MAPSHIVILGPTCSWKSEAALLVAEALSREIVSCDSMQVYKGLEIGTAQPDKHDLSRINHHLIGLLHIHEPYDVNRFLTLAQNSLAALSADNKKAVIAGGTGLYAKALIYGHSLLPADKNVFEQINNKLSMPNGRCELEEFLSNISGGRDKIPPDVLLNPRRLIRACEVATITGKAPWMLHQGNTTPNPAFSQYIILPDFNMLKERIRLRTAKMLQNGWILEAQKAIGSGLMLSPTAKQALGYRDIDAFLRGDGPDTQEQLQEILANRTIQYARRQITWFKHQHPGAQFIPIDKSENASRHVADFILANER